MKQPKTTSRFGTWACAVIVAVTLPLAGAAQVPVADTSKPLSVKTLKAKPALFLGQVISFNGQAIQVRQQNANLIRVFSYSPKVSTQMARIVAKGGYRRGDNVLISYPPGTDIAVRIKGKPSK